ncbi:hypothetical protein B0T19DRAFT_174615 [Cercophora scortea]|uniref:Uncharacterized protein n=1 Tax=Cercophora scortea TaxID=314031 RepID=A0AAE0MDL1_9PEZI|nr:hypothetical protein B0T19DRAFT_174615 [Cercophora scortea]
MDQKDVCVVRNLFFRTHAARGAIQPVQRRNPRTNIGRRPSQTEDPRDQNTRQLSGTLFGKRRERERRKIASISVRHVVAWCVGVCSFCVSRLTSYIRLSTLGTFVAQHCLRNKTTGELFGCDEHPSPPMVCFSTPWVHTCIHTAVSPALLCCK